MTKLWHVVVRVGDEFTVSLEDVTVVAFDATDAGYAGEDVVSQQHPKRSCMAMLVHPLSWQGLLPKDVVAPTFSCDVCRALTAAGKASA